MSDEYYDIYVDTYGVGPNFTSPTYDTWAGQPGHPGHKLFRRYTWKAGYSVLVTGGTASTHPGVINPTQDQIDAADSGTGAGGKAVFLGGHDYEDISAAEYDALAAAGYTVEA